MAITRTAWVDDDGTGTSGTVINNAVKTELYNQIDAGLNAEATARAAAIAADIPETQITDGALLARNAGDETITGAWAFQGLLTASNVAYLQFSANASAHPAGSIAKNAAGGLYLRPVTGSTYDFSLMNAANTLPALTMADGTNTVRLHGDLHLGSTTRIRPPSAAAGTNAYVAWLINASATQPRGMVIEYNAAAPNGTGNHFLYVFDNAVLRFAVRSNGGVENFSANNINLSDARAKALTGPGRSYRTAFRRLTFWEGKYLGSNRATDDLMVTAQDVEAIWPDLVEPFGDAGMKGVREHGLWMRGLSVLHEIDAEVVNLRREVELLKTKVTAAPR